MFKHTGRVTKDIRVINCKCGQWEEAPADQPRNHIQTFEWIRDEVFKCPDCGSYVDAEIKGKEQDENR